MWMKSFVNPSAIGCFSSDKYPDHQLREVVCVICVVSQLFAASRCRNRCLLWQRNSAVSGSRRPIRK